ncbi:hypothetical protein [Clostridium botulinum]|uniref:hypothetical protein n=1 Tax=Clostridium botulinum TaxID=1491 RepID=UPI00178C7266|nr:hypothetical protein [Clostridium botulinum]
MRIYLWEKAKTFKTKMKILRGEREITFRFIILIFSMIIVNSVKGIFIKEKYEREIIGFLF